VCVQDGKSVVSGSGDQTVRVWDVATGKAVQQLEGHSDYVQSVSFSPVRVCRARVGHLPWLLHVLVNIVWVWFEVHGEGFVMPPCFVLSRSDWIRGRLRPVPFLFGRQPCLHLLWLKDAASSILG
jgi:hypothetical protein